MLGEIALCFGPSPVSNHSCSQYDSDDKRAKRNNATDDGNSDKRTFRDFRAVAVDLVLLSLVLWPTPLAFLLSERTGDGPSAVAHGIELFSRTACVSDTPFLVKVYAVTVAATQIIQHLQSPTSERSGVWVRLTSEQIARIPEFARLE